MSQRAFGSLPTLPEEAGRLAVQKDNMNESICQSPSLPMSSHFCYCAFKHKILQLVASILVANHTVGLSLKPLELHQRCTAARLQETGVIVWAAELRQRRLVEFKAVRGPPERLFS